MRLLIVLLFWTSIASGQMIINSYAYETSSTLSNGLQARLDFEGNTNDAQGNTVTQPEGTAITFVSSLNGQAGVFGGDDALQFTDADLETLSWSCSIIYERDGTGFQIGSELSRQVSTNHSAINIYSSGQTYMTIDDSNKIGPTIAANDWVHAIATYDHTTGAYALYVDDATVASVSGTQATNNLTGDGIVYIGGRPDNSSEFLTGSIDMVAWWNRALTASEIGEEFANYTSTNE